MPFPYLDKYTIKWFDDFGASQTFATDNGLVSREYYSACTGRSKSTNQFFNSLLNKTLSWDKIIVIWNLQTKIFLTDEEFLIWNKLVKWSYNLEYNKKICM